MPNNFTATARLNDLLSAKFKSMGNNLQQGFRRMQGQAEQFQNRMSGVGRVANDVKKGLVDFAKTFGPAAIVVGLATKALFSFGQAVEFVNRVSREFAQTMSTVKAILKPNSTEMEALEAQARKLGESTVFTATEAGKAFVELGKLGLKTNQILAASGDVLNLAVVAQSEMAAAAEATARTLGQFSLRADQAGEVTDIMAKSFNISALDLTRFSEAMKFVGSTAGQMNISLSETTAALAELAGKGVVGSQAGTALRRIMLELGDANSKASTLIRGSVSATASFQEKLKALQEKELSPGTIKETFGLLSSTAAGILIQGSENVKTFTDELNNAEGTAKEFADTMLNNVAGATKLLKSAQEGLGLAIGDAFGEAKLKRIEFYTKVIQFFTGVVKANKEQFALLGTVMSDTFLTILNLGVASVRGLIGTFEILNGVLLTVWSKFAGLFGFVLKQLNKLGAEFDTTFVEGLGENLGKEAEEAFERARAAAEGLDMSKAVKTVQDAGEAIKAVDLAPTAPTAQEATETEDEAKERIAAERKVQMAMELQNRLGVLALEGREKEKAALALWFDERLSITAGNQELTQQLVDVHNQKLEAINKKFDDKNLAKRKKAIDKIIAEEKRLANKRLENQRLQEAGQRALTDALISQGSRGLQAFIKNEKASQRVAFFASIAQGALAVQRALAQPPGPPFTIPSSIATGILAAGNSATIAAQAFRDGGLIPGRNTLIRTNEEGQESVLNARATSGLGVGGVNALNSGQSIQNTTINEVNFSPTLNIEGGDRQTVIDELGTMKAEFGNFLQDQIIEKGYAKIR